MSKKEKKQFITKDIFYSSIKGAFTIAEMLTL